MRLISNGTALVVQGGYYGPYLSLPIGRSVNDGQWHHVAVTYDSTTVTGYIDGLKVGAAPFDQPLDTTANELNIGRFAGCECNYFAGSLDEVAIYPSVLSTSVVATHFSLAGYSRPTAPGNVQATAGANKAQVTWTASASPSSPITGYIVTAYAGTRARNAIAVAATGRSATLTGLLGGTAYTFQVVAVNASGRGAVGTSPAVTPSGAVTTYVGSILASGPSFYYRLGERTGSIAADSSGRGRHATSDAVLGIRGALTGDTDTAESFEQNTVRDTHYTDLPQGNSARSVEAWFSTTSNADQTLVSWGDWYSTARAFAISVTGSGATLAIWGYANDLDLPIGHSISDGQWHHVVVTYDGTTLIGYVDGAQVGSGAFILPLDTTANELTIGRIAGCSCSSFAGSLDEVAIYPTVLSEAIVTKHFNAAGYE